MFGLSLWGVAMSVILAKRVKQLRVPILAYIVIIVGFVGSGVHASLNGASYHVAVAALLFGFSDTALAINRFIRAFSYAQWVVLPSYWLALGLLALYA